MKRKNFIFNYDIALLKRKLSSSGIELIKRLLAMDPEKRISAEEALNHKWF
jgi:serine/threonine protein kinase